MDRLAAHASPFARTALANITRSYPNQPGHVLLDVSSLAEPKQLHPVFYGSYDWHSSVHMHWLLVSLLCRYPALPEADQIVTILSSHFTEANIEAETLYFQQPAHRSFERTYGWAWLLKLQAALHRRSEAHPLIDNWRDHVQPLADVIVQGWLDFLPVAQFPIRAGTHGNSAFGLLFALDYAHAAGHAELAKAAGMKAQEWFGQDECYPADYEPGGDDFLSGGLMEAALMQQVLDTDEFARWWENFCPASPALQTWLTPVVSSDRSDPKLAHLDGLNLSRAWCWAMLRSALPASLSASVCSTIEHHLEISLPCTIRGHYAGTHWLASFALLALLALEEDSRSGDS
ncbi:MAG: DUF2891 domain-containing protein [Burkholderiaceae bacterium]